ncbi:hypothetical protein [Polaribacter sp. Hel1_85]|uniref:hypothetical protein n=1 Tax=Polaribacter sp. Hel1_85 TaxID=1250005 RepID=UPI00052B8896|nr:hypothetical protein [Polaribacter sp. Hel1_85]KGL62798.1 conserved hypothetical membrane protein [Polaribacter sp. Hel1_85]
MSQKDYLRDISEIKNLMSKSSKFISLSGLSGILAGIYALIGAGYYYFAFDKKIDNSSQLTTDLVYSITIIILIVSFATTITTIFFTSRRSKFTDEKTWSITTRNLVKSYLTTLSIGGVYIIINLFQENYTHLIPLILLFYGLALINASKHTSNIVKPLGIIEVIFGLICALFPSYSFWFWVIGFGIVHVVYGSIIYFKYDKK